MNVEFVSSGNFNDRKFPVDMLVLHYTGMLTGEDALARMLDPAAGVSAHYMVWQDGRVSQLVGEDKRAWHAGVSTWQGDGDLNSRSIGVEIVNRGHEFLLPDGTLEPYPKAQIAAVITLCEGILACHDIPQSRILGHSDIAPARKEDPGEHFPWRRLSVAGIGIWPDQDDAAPVADAAQALALIGYDVADCAAAVRAFQRRWMPQHLTGTADEATRRRISSVLNAVIGR